MNECKKCGKEHEYKSRYYMCDLDNQRKEELNQLYKESENDFNEPLKYCSTLSQKQIAQIFEDYKTQGITIYNSTPDLWDNDDSNRATGRTTRLVDYYIQELFNNPNSEIEIIDHTNNQQSNVHLTQMILRRLDNEHPGIKFKIISPTSLKYNKK